jgi:hypothetical protein
MHMHMQHIQLVGPIRSSPKENFAHYIRRTYSRWQSHSSPYSVPTNLVYAIVVSVPAEEQTYIYDIHHHLSPMWRPRV